MSLEIRLPEDWVGDAIRTRLRDDFRFGTMDKVVLTSRPSDIRRALSMGEDSEVIACCGISDARLIEHPDAGLLHVIDRELYESLVGSR